jgi:hypothetical protein
MPFCGLGKISRFSTSITLNCIALHQTQLPTGSLAKGIPIKMVTIHMFFGRSDSQHVKYVLKIQHIC